MKTERYYVDIVSADGPIPEYAESFAVEDQRNTTSTCWIPSEAGKVCICVLSSYDAMFEPCSTELSYKLVQSVRRQRRNSVLHRRPHSVSHPRETRRGGLCGWCTGDGRSCASVCFFGRNCYWCVARILFSSGKVLTGRQTTRMPWSHPRTTRTSLAPLKCTSIASSFARSTTGTEVRSHTQILAPFPRSRRKQVATKSRTFSLCHLHRRTLADIVAFSLGHVAAVPSILCADVLMMDKPEKPRAKFVFRYRPQRKPSMLLYPDAISCLSRS